MGINLVLILLLSFLFPVISNATVAVQRYPSGTPVQVCQASDINTNCGGGSGSSPWTESSGNLYPTTLSDTVSIGDSTNVILGFPYTFAVNNSTSDGAEIGINSTNNDGFSEIDFIQPTNTYKGGLFLSTYNQISGDPTNLSYGFNMYSNQNMVFLGGGSNSAISFFSGSGEPLLLTTSKLSTIASPPIDNNGEFSTQATIVEINDDDYSTGTYGMPLSGLIVQDDFNDAVLYRGYEIQAFNSSTGIPSFFGINKYGGEFQVGNPSQINPANINMYGNAFTVNANGTQGINLSDGAGDYVEISPLANGFTSVSANGISFTDNSIFGISFVENNSSGIYFLQNGTYLNYEGSKLGVNQVTPLYALDVYDAAATGFDIGNSTTGDWNISNVGKLTIANILDNGLTASELVATDSSKNLVSITALPSGTTATTQASTDNSTKVATTAYVTTGINNAIAGVNPAVAVQAATAAVLPNSPTYSNGVSGIGATLTAGVTNTALVVDGYTPTINQRILVKNQASTFQNGVYYVSQVSGVALAWILTRALDYDQPSDITNTGAIPVVSGTANANTSWLLTSSVTTVGTDSLTYTQFSYAPASTARIIMGSFTTTTCTVVSGGGASAACTMSSGTLTVTHNFAEASPYMVMWQINDTSNNPVVPTGGNVTYNTNSTVFNTTFAGSISGEFVITG